jgi:glycerol uptake facilitator-like aquaporin
MVTHQAARPALTFGRDFASGTFPALWVYLAGPVLAALLPAVVFPLLSAAGGC